MWRDSNKELPNTGFDVTPNPSGGSCADLRSEADRLLALAGQSWGVAKVGRLITAYQRTAGPGQSLEEFVYGTLLERGLQRAAARIPAADRANAAGHTDKTGETATWNVHLEEGIHP